MLCPVGMLPLEGTLLEKLRKIEALHAGTKIDGEREAAVSPAGPAVQHGDGPRSANVS